MYSDAFEHAVNHAMLYEVGGHWQLSEEVELGLIETRAQRRAVGYVNDPDDAGGETKFGVAKNANPDLDITNLTWEQAKDVYYNKYWIAGKCHQLPSRVAVLHFDGCVNHGPRSAAKFLQRALGVQDDGVIGPATLDAAEQADEFELCMAISQERAKFYQNIVRNKPSQAKFLKGWLRRIEEMEQYTCNPDNTF